MPTARANKQHWLSPAGRSLLTLPVSGVLLFLMLIGGAGTLLPSAYEHLFAPAHNESGPEDPNEEEEETATPAAPSVGVPRARKSRTGSPSARSNASSLLLNAGAVLGPRQLISASPVRAVTKPDGAGISLRC